MNHFWIAESLHDLHSFPNFIRRSFRSFRERCDRKAYSTHGMMQNTYKVTVGKPQRVEIIYDTWRCGDDINAADLNSL